VVEFWCVELRGGGGVVSRESEPFRGEASHASG
jgi:hypothetical protein